MSEEQPKIRARSGSSVKRKSQHGQQSSLVREEFKVLELEHVRDQLQQFLSQVLERDVPKDLCKHFENGVGLCELVETLFPENAQVKPPAYCICYYYYY